MPGSVPSAGDTTENNPCHHEAHEGSSKQTIKIISFISLIDKKPGQRITEGKGQGTNSSLWVGSSRSEIGREENSRQKGCPCTKAPRQEISC